MYTLLTDKKDEQTKNIQMDRDDDGEVNIYVNGEIVAWFNPVGELVVDRDHLRGVGFALDIIGDEEDE